MDLRIFEKYDLYNKYHFENAVNGRNGQCFSWHQLFYRSVSVSSLEQYTGIKHPYITGSGVT